LRSSRLLESLASMSPRLRLEFPCFLEFAPPQRIPAPDPVHPGKRRRPSIIHLAARGTVRKIAILIRSSIIAAQPGNIRAECRQPGTNKQRGKRADHLFDASEGTCRQAARKKALEVINEVNLVVIAKVGKIARVRFICGYIQPRSSRHSLPYIA